jgi:hypothetical protein
MAIHGVRNALTGCPIPGTAYGTSKDAAIVKGQPVFRDTDGDIDGCATSAAEVIGIASETPAADVSMCYEPIRDGDEFLMDFVKATAYAVTDLGLYFGLKVTSGDPEVDLSVTNADALQLIAIESQVTAGTSGKAWVRWIDAVRQDKIVNA